MIERIDELIFGHPLNEAGNIVLYRLPEQCLHSGEEAAQIVGGNHDIPRSIAFTFQESLVVESDVVGVVHLTSFDHSRKTSLTV